MSAAGSAASTPEERLEQLRFFAVECDPEQRDSIATWMQEVEAQIANLRQRLNDLPLHATREPIRW